MNRKGNRTTSSPSSQDAWQLRTLCLALALYACLLIIRGYTMGLTTESLSTPLKLAGQILAGAKYDLLFIGLLACCFSVFQHLASRRITIHKIINISYLWIAQFCLVLAIINVTVVHYLGGPLNYQWFYYSDFGMSTDVHDALSSIVSWKTLVAIPIAMVGMIAISNMLAVIVRRLKRGQQSNRPVIVLLTVLFGAAFLLARPYWASYDWNDGKIANPTIYFLRSLATRNDAPLLSMATTVSSEDFRIFSERSNPKNVDNSMKYSKIRNVLIYVMESVPAEYLATYGSPYPVTPTIKDHIEHSIQFENVYAHAPNSHKSLISILTSSYPLISYKTLTKEMPDAEFASMSKRLKKLGYRTGFFYSADLRYAQIDQFLSHHTFDVIKDYRSIDCGVEFDSYGKEAFLKHSTDDRCTAGSASDWIRSGDQNPFFAIVWTNMTHIPYYTAIPDKLYTTEDSILNRYLNALYHGDQSLGLLLDSLREENLLASTLVVVTGDHGEAFGQHGQRGHGANLYEENIHVPLILINPLIGTGERREIVGGLVDIAPTVFQILGLPPSQFWQGSSLLNPNKPPRTYFFSTWTDLQFGYREKEQKYIFNATANKCESYNLTADPEETQGRLLVSDEKCLKIQERLAAWIQYQHSLTDKLSRALQ